MCLTFKLSGARLRTRNRSYLIQVHQLPLMTNGDDAACPLQRKLDATLSRYKMIHGRFRKVSKIELKVGTAKVSPFYAPERAPSHKASLVLFRIIDRNYWLTQVPYFR
jgi:hypothetical protein